MTCLMGQMMGVLHDYIRHPAKVKIEVLSSGIDTVVLSFDVGWKDTELFKYLEEIKKLAQESSVDYPGSLPHFKQNEKWPFVIKPNGSKGYSWILVNNDYTFKIADRQEPGTRPNMMAEIRSEALWRLGPQEAIEIADKLIQASQGLVVEAKPSRIDLCLDYMMPEKYWNQSLLDYVVTRATDFSPYYHHRVLNGIRIGKGDISARLYDKPLEISQRSKKLWMYDIWALDEIPPGQKIIRIEFQLRRPVLKELGLNSDNDLVKKAPGIWAYCTGEWLKFMDRPGLHHTQRKTFEWYKHIQEGFQGVQDAVPAIRNKVVRADKDRLIRQANGLIISLKAIDQGERGINHGKPLTMTDAIITYAQEIANHQMENEDIEERLKKKRSRYHRVCSLTGSEGDIVRYKLREAGE